MRKGKAGRTVLVIVSCIVLLSTLIANPVVAAPEEKQDLPDDCRNAISHIPTPGNQSPDVSLEYRSRPNGTVVSNYTVRRDHIPYSFRLSVPDEFEIVESNGFSQDSDGDLVWDQDTEEPSVVYRVRILDWISAGRDLPAGASRYHSNSSNYTISYIPNHGGATFNVSFPEGGEIGSSIMLIGEVDRVETIERGCHTVRFVVPEGVDNESVEAAKAPIVNATTGLGIGGHFDETTLFVDPTHTSGYGWHPDAVFGANWNNQTSGKHVPLHEYVHMRQGQELEEDMYWYQEGSATYLTARFLLDEGYISNGEYNNLLAVLRSNSGGGQLRDAQSWDPKYDYNQGAIFLASLDRDLRNQSNATIFDVVNEMNSGDGPISYAVFEHQLESHGLQLDEGLQSKQLDAKQSEPSYTQEALWTPMLIFGIQAETGLSLWGAHALMALTLAVISLGIGWEVRTGLRYLVAVVRS